MVDFPQWLGSFLNQDESEVKQILNKDFSLQFLILWNLFEAKCFDNRLRPEKLICFSKKFENKDFKFIEKSKYFYDRYQDREKLKNLLYGGVKPKKNENSEKNKSPEEIFQSILKSDYFKIPKNELIFLTLFVVYRYRNNMFHGNKGVSSWLKFEEQIKFCNKIMQEMIIFSKEELENNRRIFPMI